MKREFKVLRMGERGGGREKQEGGSWGGREGKEYTHRNISLAIFSLFHHKSSRIFSLPYKQIYYKYFSVLILYGV